MKKTLRIATRKSALALWQANHVEALLREAHPGIEIELVKIVTEGDRILDRPLSQIGGKGLFLKELEVSMLNGDSDLAVHSMKDVPANMADGLVLDAVLPRANPYDALVSRDNLLLADLPAGSNVGTSSLRRKSQLLALRPDLKVTDLRGNVDTRLRKLDEGQYDAIILACAGLQRLGLGERISETLQLPDWLPASTQGIIGLQCRQDDEYTRSLIEPLADSNTMVVASAERAVARVLEATCQVPLAAHAVLNDGRVKLKSMVSSPDGKQSVEAAGEAQAAEAAALGERVAAELLKNGAGTIIANL
jgi:hydroxymethylbilane synthase